MRTYLCDPSRGKRYGKLKRIRTWTVKYRRDRNRTKTVQIEWLSNEKNLLMCTEVSSSIILTKKTKLVLIRFKQVRFLLQSWVFQCISHFFTFPYSCIQLPPALSLPVPICIYLGGERHCEIKVTCPRTQCNAAPDQGSNPNRSIRHVATRLPSMLQ